MSISIEAVGSCLCCCKPPKRQQVHITVFAKRQVLINNWRKERGLHPYWASWSLVFPAQALPAWFFFPQIQFWDYKVRWIAYLLFNLHCSLLFASKRSCSSSSHPPGDVLKDNLTSSREKVLQILHMKISVEQKCSSGYCLLLLGRYLPGGPGLSRQ